MALANIKTYRLTLTFLTAYLVDLLVYIFVIKTIRPPYWQGFLTAPFSPVENYDTSLYSNPTVGYVSNLGGVAFLILFCELYLRVLRPSRLKPNPATLAFGLSIIASYALSGLLWLTTGVPSAGTSIIGSCTALTVVYFAASDAWAEAPRKSFLGRKAPTPWIPIVFLAVPSAFYYVNYVNSALLSHILGDVIFVLLFIAVLNRTEGIMNRPTPGRPKAGF